MKDRHVICLLRLWILLLLLAALSFGVLFHLSVRAGASWSEATIISRAGPGVRSWWPDMTIDDSEHVYVVWSQTARIGEGESEQTFYTYWGGQEWSTPNSVLPPQRDIRRSAIAADRLGNLFLVSGESRAAAYSLVFTSAPAARAWSAAEWTRRRAVNAHGGTYMAELEADQLGHLHLLFDDSGYDSIGGRLGGHADVYFRRSEDSGRTWSAPLNLAQASAGCSREQLVVDAKGNLHATWDEGWDRLSGRGQPDHSVYRASYDGGLSWSTPVTITYPTTGTMQLVSAANGAGGIMLVWRTMLQDSIFYQWSSDWGKSWSSPGTVPGVLARPWQDTMLDRYAAVSDSAGQIHLLVVGLALPEAEAPRGVYHIIWDGERWSPPVKAYSGAGYPEFPRLAISAGNHLHAVWFVRDNLHETGNCEVWYSDSYSAAPHEPPQPLPVPTATQVIAPTETARPVATLRPTPASSAETLRARMPTESRQVVRVAAAITPVLFLLLAVVGRRLLYRRR